MVGRAAPGAGARRSPAPSRSPAAGSAKRLTRPPGSSDYFRGSAVVLHGGREARRARRAAGDDRRPRRGERGVRPGDGGGGAAGVPVGRGGVADGRGRARSAHDGKPPGEVWIGARRGGRATARGTPGAGRPGAVRAVVGAGGARPRPAVGRGPAGRVSGPRKPSARATSPGTGGRSEAEAAPAVRRGGRARRRPRRAAARSPRSGGRMPGGAVDPAGELARDAEVPGGRTWPRCSTGSVDAVERGGGGAHGLPRPASTGVGAFPSARRARVVWAGVEDRHGGLARARPARSTAPGVRTSRPEERPFAPHLTLARLNPPGLRECRPSWRISTVASRPFARAPAVLYRSHLQRPAARYEVAAASSRCATDPRLAPECFVRTSVRVAWRRVARVESQRV